MDIFYFYRKDLNALDKKIREYSEKIKAIGKEVGGACIEGAETWHDNFAYEQGQRDMEMWSSEFIKLKQIRERSRLIDPETSRGIVAIGRKITVHCPETDQISVLKIGSYMLFAEEEDPSKNGYQEISYSSPLAQLIMLAKEGDQRTGEIGGQPKTLIIKKIE